MIQISMHRSPFITSSAGRAFLIQSGFTFGTILKKLGFPHWETLQEARKYLRRRQEIIFNHEKSMLLSKGCWDWPPMVAALAAFAQTGRPGKKEHCQSPR